MRCIQLLTSLCRYGNRGIERLSNLPLVVLVSGGTRIQIPRRPGSRVCALSRYAILPLGCYYRSLLSYSACPFTPQQSKESR